MKHFIFITGLCLIALFFYLPTPSNSIQVQCLEENCLDSLEARIVNIEQAVYYSSDSRRPEQ